MKTSDENKSETKWAPIFKDMAILMCVMGVIALICKLIMMPFEITTPTDTLVSLIRKGGVTAVKHKDAPLEVKDEPFIKELRKVTCQARPEHEEKGFFESLCGGIPWFGAGAREEQVNHINSQDNTGRTPLMWAVYSNYNNPPTADVMEYLFSQAKGQLAAYEKLATAKPDPKDKEAAAEKLADLAAAMDTECAMLNATLKEIQEQLNRGDNVSWNKKDVQRLYYLFALLQAPGIDVHATDIDGFTALHWAAWSGMPYCCFSLVQAGLDINAQEKNGYTPLMLAAMRGNADAVEMLLRLGADKELTNAKGASATSLATAAATSYHKSDTFVYTLIYSKQRNDFYARTVKALKDGVTPLSAEEIGKQMNAAWSRFERQLLDAAKNKEKAEDQEVKEEEEKVQDAAGEPAYSDNPAQAPSAQVE